MCLTLLHAGHAPLHGHPFLNAQERDGLLRVRAYVGSERGADGKVHLRYENATFDTELEAKRWEEAARVDARREGLPERQRFTVGEWLDEWLKTEARPNRAAQSARASESFIRNHLKPSLGRIRLDRLTTQRIKRFREDKLAAGLSPATVKQAMVVLKASLNDAVRLDLLRSNPALRVTLPRTTKKRFATLPAELVPALLDALRAESRTTSFGR